MNITDRIRTFNKLLPITLIGLPMCLLLISSLATQLGLAQQNSPLIGTWRHSTSGDPPATQQMSFFPDGTYRGSYAIGSGSNIPSPPALTEWTGNYRLTGANSFVFTPLRGRTMVGGIWYYCPPAPNQMLDACTTVQSLAGTLGQSSSGSFQMKGANQLLTGGEIWYRIR
ncbi:hypothetical protein [Microcystis viridis]|jgi:hypothetical protein|nr:hypothetical protein [Microcystis viridis]